MTDSSKTPAQRRRFLRAASSTAVAGAAMAAPSLSRAQGVTPHYPMRAAVPELGLTRATRSKRL